MECIRRVRSGIPYRSKDHPVFTLVWELVLNKKRHWVSLLHTSATLH